MDVIIVRYLAWKAKRLARKWGGQCIVFIDEIDAVGRRRSALGDGGMGGFATPIPMSFEEFAFHGRNGSLTSTGDLVLETRAWRDKLFAARMPERRPSGLSRFGAIVNQAFPGAMMGGMGQLALNQLLVVMDGIDNPPFTRKLFTNRINTFLDATYIVPRRVFGRSMRLPPPRPRTEQIYFIGATNVPLEALDPALTRPGRMGRYVWLRTPTKKDRLDIFDLYLAKVAHDPDLDSEKRRDEIARITNGYSPAMIEQVCSMALTYAHHEGKPRFGWQHRVHPRGDACDRSARSGPRGRRPRLHEGSRVDASLDPAPRRGARPPPGAREGGALQLLAQRRDGAPDLDAGRDGRRACLLRRELHRRRR
jgi:SpoVK/Ycf46/Vps4 family AAA+-type ATPase